jgi:hypothetical protein
MTMIGVVEILVTVLSSVGAHSWAVAPSFRASKIAAMHYSRIQNVTPADSWTPESPLGPNCSPREEEPGEVQAATFTAPGLWTGGPPNLSTRCICHSF